MSFTNQAWSMFKLARPLFLAGGFVFHALGLAIALYSGIQLNWWLVVWGQIAITSIHLMTNFSNDYFDLAADRANTTPTTWSGGSRMLADGHLPPQAGLRAALVCAASAVLAIVVMVIWFGISTWAVALLLLAMFLAWEYSAPPLRLHSRGWGELTVALTVPVLTPLVGYTLQAGSPAWLPLLATLPLACFQAAMILVINMHDAAGDAAAGKRTLVIRLGDERAVRLYLSLLPLAYGVLPLLVMAGLPAAVAVAILAVSPIAIWQWIRMARGQWADETAWNSLAFWSIGLLMASALAETAAFLWLVLAGG